MRLVIIAQNSLYPPHKIRMSFVCGGVLGVARRLP